MSAEKSKPALFIETVISVGVEACAKRLPQLPADQAEELMTEVAFAICNRFNRTEMYIPADLQSQWAARNAQIWAQYCQAGPGGTRAFSQARIDQLAAEHRLTTRQIRNIVSKMQDQDLAGRQGMLALDTSAE